ncbi:MAG: B12-binding domain-containing radical SAM protein [Candidatus Aminicenantes bacterium]|nr:MAG: B12-binding domain-containing radical SAM protein [Candidatus Aminicenantes bacterium]
MNSNEKIVLVVPLSRTHYVVPPIGLGYMAAALRNEGFNDIGILDCLKENLGLKNFGKRIARLGPAVVGFQLYSYDFNFVVRGISVVKELLPGSIVIIGGPHVSATATLALREIPGADFGFVGEGEVGLPLLMKRLLRKENIPFQGIPGLIYREGNRVRMNPRAVITDLDDLGLPAWDLMVPGEYPDSPQGGFYRNFPIAPISTTRGCPYSCAFCGSTVNMGKKLRFRSIPMVLAEMQMLYNEYGVREFHIIDDMFNFHKQRVIDFCNGVREHRLDISYTFPNGLRLNHLDLEMLQMMKDTGAYSFNVGIESGSQRILDMMKKNLTLELIEEKVNLIVEAGLEPCGFFIIGFPGETIEDIKATIRFARRLKLKRAHFSNFLPLPGTEATRRLIESREIERLVWEDLFYAKVPYAPQGISKRKLKSLQRRAYLSFHLRPLILFRMLSEIKSMNHLKLTLKRIWDYLFRK